jgi:hypothetical protein
LSTSVNNVGGFQSVYPTLTSFAAPVASTNEDTEVAVSFANLAAQGNQAVSVGSVSAFVVKTVSTGSLRIGANAGSATAFNAITNAAADPACPTWANRCGWQRLWRDRTARHE